MNGGGMHRGPGGVHFTTNFGGMPRGFRQQQHFRGGQQQQQQQEPEAPGLANLIQMLPFLMILLLSFFNMNNDYSAGSTGSGSSKSPGLNRYFTLAVSQLPAFEKKKMFSVGIEWPWQKICLFQSQFRFFLIRPCDAFCLSISKNENHFHSVVSKSNSANPQEQDPFVNPLNTKLTSVKDIPYFVDNKFLRTLYRDR